MPTISPILLGLGLLAAGDAPPRPADLDVAPLQELLHDRQSPRGQSQAALLLVQSGAAGAEAAVRAGLKAPQEADTFLALAGAVRLCRDTRFTPELLAALSVNRPSVRQAAAEALAVLADADLVRRLAAAAADDSADLAARQAALWALGRCGHKQAAPALLARLAGGPESLRRAAADALADLSGQDYGLDAARWRAWWGRHKGLSNERWLELRLAFQTSRAQRLEGDLARSRTQVLRLEQQLYARLPGAERPAHILSLLNQEDPAVRVLAVSWALELLPAADEPRQRLLAQALLRLSADPTPEVQRAAVLGLGLVYDPAAAERLRVVLERGRPSVRAAAVRALARQARGGDAEAAARQKAVVPALQKALTDTSLEVVVEAAEALGELGAPEAGPVLKCLLEHPSEPVRQAAAQALERVADAHLLDALLGALDDPSATVRFSLVGALAHAAGDGAGLSPAQRERLLARLEALLRRDADPGVRSRAATVLGGCGTAANLAALWQGVLAAEDGRVQEKAWAAFVEVIARAGSLPLLQEWDRTLTGARQGPRRLQLLAEVAARWQKRPELKDGAARAQEALVQAQLDLGKWAAAGPAVRELLARTGSDAERDRCLRWLLTVGEQALQEGNRSEAARAARDAEPYLQGGKLSASFERLRKEAEKR
jgi:HEAT repeat protein